MQPPEAKRISIQNTLGVHDECSTALACDLVTEALKAAPKATTFLDPCCGTGALLSAMQQAKDLDITAFEIHPKKASAAGNLFSGRYTKVFNKDFFAYADSSTKLYDIILGVPPLVSRESKAVPKDAAFKKSGLALNLSLSIAVYFVAAATPMLAANGAAIWLLTENFFTASSSRPVRQWLARHYNILRVHYFDGNVLDFTRTGSKHVLLVLKKEAPTDSLLVSKGSLESPYTSETLPVMQLFG